jgi:glycosyl transferase family 87
MNKPPPQSKAVLWLLLSILSCGSMAYYVAEIWSANQPPHFTDFYAPWWGAHELLLHGRNPYSPEVAHEIQTVIYGAPAIANSADDPSSIAGGFAYPPYAALLLWPTVYLSFSSAQIVFLGVSALGTLLSLWMWLRVFRLRLAPRSWLTIALFVLGSFPALQAFKLQNLSLIAATLIAVTLFLLSANRLVLAGIFLAVSTLKPQFTIALIPWLALWTVSDWRRRRPLAWSFLTAMLLLVLFSELLLPGWIRRFVYILGAYRRYTYGHSLLDVWFTPMLGLLVAASFLLAVLLLCWRHRSQPADSMPFFLVTSLLLAATLTVIPTLAPHAQLLLLPGFLCLVRGRTLLSSTGVLPRLVVAATWALLAWPWIAAFGLLLAACRFPVSKLLRFWDVPLYTSPLLPLAVSFALGCLVLAGRGRQPWSDPREYSLPDLSHDLPGNPAILVAKP